MTIGAGKEDRAVGRSMSAVRGVVRATISLVTRHGPWLSRHPASPAPPIHRH